MKNKRIFLPLLMIVFCLLAGIIFHRHSPMQIPENPRVYEQKIYGDEYAYLTYEDKMFVPYCPYEAEYLGECIGYYDIPVSEYSDAGRIYVCELKGYSSEEWIIAVLDTNCTEGMILREINATEIPEGLDTEYKWNQ